MQKVSSQPTQRAVFLLLTSSLFCWEMPGNPNTPCTFFCVQCLGRSQPFSRAVPSLEGLCFPEHPLRKSPFFNKSQTACRCLAGCSHASPCFPRAPTDSLAWTEGTELPETPAIQMKDIQEKRHKASLAKPQLSGSEQGKKVGTARRSRAQLDQQERSLRSVQPEPCEHCLPASSLLAAPDTLLRRRDDSCQSQCLWWWHFI